jgi:hypothetical protein
MGVGFYGVEGPLECRVVARTSTHGQVRATGNLPLRADFGLYCSRFTPDSGCPPAGTGTAECGAR